MVHCHIGDMQLVAQVAPDTPAQAGTPMQLVADMNQMHLIDPAGGAV